MKFSDAATISDYVSASKVTVNFGYPVLAELENAPETFGNFSASPVQQVCSFIRQVNQYNAWLYEMKLVYQPIYC